MKNLWKKIVMQLQEKTGMNIWIVDGQKIIDFIGDVDKGMDSLQKNLSEELKRMWKRKEKWRMLEGEEGISIVIGQAKTKKSQAFYRMEKEKKMIIIEKESEFFTDEEKAWIQSAFYLLDKYF